MAFALQDKMSILSNFFDTFTTAVRALKETSPAWMDSKHRLDSTLKKYQYCFPESTTYSTQNSQQAATRS